MTREELINGLAFINDGQLSKHISLYVTAEGGDLQLFNMVQDDLDELLPEYIFIINDLIINKEGLNVGDYSTSISRENMIYVYDLGEKKRTSEMVRMSTAGTEMNPEYFSCKNESLEKVNGIYVAINDDRQRIVLYKEVLPVEKTYGRKSIFFGCRSDNSMFERKKDSLLRITPGFQMIYVGDSIILVDMQKLEKSLGLDVILQKEKKRTIQEIRAKKIIQDTDKLDEVCKKPSMLKKLRHALKDSRTKNIPNETIIRFAKDHDKLKFKFSEDGTQFCLDSKAAAERFIKLLDDDFLYSSLTETEYESELKGELS